MSSVDDEKLQRLKDQLEKFKKGEKVKGRSRTTPLARLFGIISAKLDVTNDNNLIKNLFFSFGGDSANNDRYEIRETVIDYLLGYLEQINELSIKKEQSDVISIPLYDIKIVGQITNLIIVHGIYSLLPNGYLIPLEKRNLKNFKNSNTFYERLSIDNPVSVRILNNILSTFVKIFESDSDLKDLILVGTGFTDTLSVAIFWSIKFDDTSFLKALETQSSTYQLLSYYSMLFQNSKTSKDPKLTQFLSENLTTQLLASNGIEALIDLVMGLRDDVEIDVSKIQYIVHIIINSRPKSNVSQYFSKIFGQIYKLLILVNRPIMNTVVVEILTNIYNMNKKVVTDFFFKNVWLKLNPKISDENSNIVLTNAIDLNNSFNVCLSISRSINTSVNFDFINDLFNPILLPLWNYTNYQKSTKKDYEIVLNLLKNIIVIGDSNFLLSILINNIMEDNEWKFATDTENNLTYIKYDTKEEVGDDLILNLFDKIDFKVNTFVELIRKLNDLDDKYFDEILILCLNRLLKKDKHILDGLKHSVTKIVDLKLIQVFMETFKEEIEKSPNSLMIFLNTYFIQYFKSFSPDSKLHIVKQEETDSDDEDDDEDEAIDSNKETLALLIPILELISTISPANESEKERIDEMKSLFQLNYHFIPNSIKFLADKIINLDTDVKVKEINKDLFNLETILKQINDPIPSIRVYALDKLTEYTTNEEETNKKVSTKYTLNLLLSQLKDPEPFVYLNSIKNIVLILTFDRSYFDLIMDLYYNSNRGVDEKLKIGEVITKFININGKLLIKNDVDKILAVLLEISRFDSKFDIKIKMSTLSILGLVCYECGYNILSYINDVIDLIKNVITFEKDSPELRRASVHIVNDITSNKDGLEIVKQFGENLQNLLEYIQDFDNDLLACQLATETLNNIDNTFKEKFKI